MEHLRLAASSCSANINYDLTTNFLISVHFSVIVIEIHLHGIKDLLSFLPCWCYIYITIIYSLTILNCVTWPPLISYDYHIFWQQLVLLGLRMFVLVK